MTEEENKIENKKEETATVGTKEVKTDKKKETKIVKKDEAVARGESLHISKKQAVYICRFIKGKKVDDAIKDLQSVTKLKKAVPFKGEIPHRKGNIMSGRYPVRASKIIINVIKGLKGNISANGMDLDKTRIYYASANWASRPVRSDRRLGKRTNLVLKAKEFKK